MSNLWEFLLQSLTISMIAAIILIVKYIFRDKLSARWHYGIWGVLALRIIIPADGGGKYVLLPLELWIETLKGAIEGELISSYSKVFEAMSIRLPFPIVSSWPTSITDWIFVIYFIGVIVVLARYFFTYIRLRRLLKNGASASIENQEQINSIAFMYKLKPCKAVEIEGIPSAFVCGIAKPILVIPADTKTDDKVFLHELLHLKYMDALQSTLWCILRSLHWCNPFICYVFNRIENDMEILCDQRVLERLQGEERRDYGNILLSMVNEKYPCALGTTSISNGGKNIARRIISITRFKKYPKGMAIISICISVILVQYFFFGMEASGIEFKEGYFQSKWDFHKAMASARINRCTTIAGALDTYAKGIMYNNGLYIAAASPLGAHEELAGRMRENLKSNNMEYYYIDGDLHGEVNIDEGSYAIYNLIEIYDKTYKADIAFAIKNLYKPETSNGLYTEEGLPIGGFIVYPVTITYEDSWVVKNDGDKKIYSLSTSYDQSISYGNSVLPGVFVYSAEGETATLTASVQTAYTIDNSILENSTDEIFFSTVSFNEKPLLNAEFSKGYSLTEFIYKYEGSEEDIEDIYSIGMLRAELLSKEEDKNEESKSSGYTVNQWEIDGRISGWSSEYLDENWDGRIISIDSDEIDVTNNKIADIPLGYTVKVYFDAVLQETITLKSGDFLNNHKLIFIEESKFEKD